jgi:stage II sporulation protein AA (anti-sigma F factor antagonist)
VVVDLAGVTFIDSSAIQALMTAHRCLAGEGREFRLRHLSVPVARLFELTGLTNLVDDTGEPVSHPDRAEQP